MGGREGRSVGATYGRREVRIVSGPTPNKALFKELVAPPWGI